MKPGFENFNGLADVKPAIDVDLDGEIYADQLHSLLQRNVMDPMQPLKPNAPPSKPAKKTHTDSEMVLDKIYGIDDEPVASKPFAHVQPRVHIPHRGGAFEGFVDGPRTHRQSFSYQMVRRPDGTMVKTKTVVDPEGNTKTIIERTEHGEIKTQTLINGVELNGALGNGGGGSGGGGNLADIKDFKMLQPRPWIVDTGRYMAVNKDGYALPKNLW